MAEIIATLTITRSYMGYMPAHVTILPQQWRTVSTKSSSIYIDTHLAGLRKAKISAETLPCPNEKGVDGLPSVPTRFITASLIGGRFVLNTCAQADGTHERTPVSHFTLRCSHYAVIVLITGRASWTVGFKRLPPYSFFGTPSCNDV